MRLKFSLKVCKVFHHRVKIFSGLLFETDFFPSWVKRAAAAALLEIPHPREVSSPVATLVEA